MSDFYYVIACSEDGEVSLHTFDEDELRAELDSGGIDGDEVEVPPATVYDFASGQCPVVIIKGKAIKPLPVKKATKWQV